MVACLIFTYRLSHSWFHGTPRQLPSFIERKICHIYACQTFLVVACLVYIYWLSHFWLYGTPGEPLRLIHGHTTYMLASMIFKLSHSGLRHDSRGSPIASTQHNPTWSPACSSLTKVRSHHNTRIGILTISFLDDSVLHRRL